MNKWRTILWSSIGKVKVAKILVFPKLIYTITLKISARYFVDINKSILKFIWKAKIPRIKVKLKSLSCVPMDFVTPWTVAYQAPLSMGFSRQEYWSGLPFPSLIPRVAKIPRIATQY